MNMLDEAGKIAANVVETFKATPVILALVLMDFAMLGFLFWYSANVLDQRRQTVEIIAGLIQDTNKALSHCVSDDVMRSLIDAVRHGREMQRQ